MESEFRGLGCLDVHFLSGISPSFVLSVAIDAIDILFGAADLVGECRSGVRLRSGGTVSVLLYLLFPADDLYCAGGGEEEFDFLTLFGSRLFEEWMSLGSPRLFADEPSPLLLELLFDEAVELDDECPLLRLELVEVVTTVSLEDVLPKRRESWSNVLSVSDLEALDKSMSDS